MNPGEEKRFDGLLKNKFHEFEAAPNAAVWQTVSQTLPPAKSGLMQRAIPFGLGTAFGIMVSLGFVSGYQHLTGDSTGSNPTAQTVLTPANQPETASAPALATTPAAPAGSVAAGMVNSGAAQRQGSGTENAMAMATTEAAPNTASDHRASTSYSHRRVVTTEYQHNRYTTSETADYQEAASRSARQNQSVSEAAPVAAIAPVTSVNTTANTQAEAPKAPVNTIAQTPVNAAPSAWLTGHELDTAIAKALSVDPKLTANKGELKELLKAQGTVLAVLQNRNDSLLLALKDSELDSTIAKVRINRPRRHSSSIKPPVGWASPSKWALTANYEANPQWGGITMAHSSAKATENVRNSRTISIGIKHRVNQQLSLSGGLGVILVESEMNYSRKQSFTEENPITGQITTHLIDQNQFLRPDYSFITVPLAMSYRFGGYGHLGIGFTFGAQTNLYRGGTMAVYQNDQYMLTKASASEGPFRKLSVAATTGLDFSYRVGPKLTVQGGPTLRYWAVSPYKQSDAGFKFLPGLQLGVSWDL